MALLRIFLCLIVEIRHRERRIVGYRPFAFLPDEIQNVLHRFRWLKRWRQVVPEFLKHVPLFVQDGWDGVAGVARDAIPPGILRNSRCLARKEDRQERSGGTKERDETASRNHNRAPLSALPGRSLQAILWRTLFLCSDALGLPNIGKEEGQYVAENKYLSGNSV